MSKQGEATVTGLAGGPVTDASQRCMRVDGSPEWMLSAYGQGGRVAPRSRLHLIRLRLRELDVGNGSEESPRGVRMKADWLFCRAWGLICVSQRTRFGKVTPSECRTLFNVTRVSTWEFTVAACAYDNSHSHTRIEFHFIRFKKTKCVFPSSMSSVQSVQFIFIGPQGKLAFTAGHESASKYIKKYPKNVFVTMAEEGCIR